MLVLVPTSPLITFTTDPPVDPVSEESKPTSQADATRKLLLEALENH